MMRLVLCFSVFVLSIQDAGGFTQKCLWFDNFCYSVFKMENTWDAANNFCNSNGSHLASITSQSETTFLMDYLSGSDRVDLWIGYNDKNREANFEWTDGSPSYTNWLVGQPNNIDGIEDCVEIKIKYDGGWNDDRCSRNNSYICETAKNCTVDGCVEYRNSYYKFVASPVTDWDSAQNACQALSGNLAIISDPSEQTFVFNKAKQAKVNGSFWIGYNDKAKEANFVWPDGSQFYTNWEEEEPNNYDNGEECVAMYSGTSKWNDYDCSTKLGFICKVARVYIDCKGTTVNEKSETATVQLKRKEELSKNITIYCETRNGTAKQSDDYVYTKNSLVFGPGESQKNFTVPLVNNEKREPDEEFKINCTTNEANVNFLPTCLTNNFKVLIKEDDTVIGCKGLTVGKTDRFAVISYNRTGFKSSNITATCSFSFPSQMDFASSISNMTITFGENIASKMIKIPIPNLSKLNNSELLINISCSTVEPNVDFLQSCNNIMTVEFKTEDSEDDGTSGKTKNDEKERITNALLAAGVAVTCLTLIAVFAIVLCAIQEINR